MALIRREASASPRSPRDWPPSGSLGASEWTGQGLRSAPCSGRLGYAALGFRATWVAIASISAGDRQS